MRPALALAATVAAVLLAPALATAKEIKKATFCGASACRSITDAATLRRLVESGERRMPPPAPRSYC
jgi:hypothetical protein